MLSTVSHVHASHNRLVSVWHFLCCCIASEIDDAEAASGGCSNNSLGIRAVADVLWLRCKVHAPLLLWTVYPNASHETATHTTCCSCAASTLTDVNVPSAVPTASVLGANGSHPAHVGEDDVSTTRNDSKGVPECIYHSSACVEPPMAQVVRCANVCATCNTRTAVMNGQQQVLDVWGRGQVPHTMCMSPRCALLKLIRDCVVLQQHHLPKRRSAMASLQIKPPPTSLSSFSVFVATSHLDSLEVPTSAVIALAVCLSEIDGELVIGGLVNRFVHQPSSKDAY